jgi:hypothetical protein
MLSAPCIGPIINQRSTTTYVIVVAGVQYTCNSLYADPIFDAPPEFIQRIGEISMLEVETIRCERNPARKMTKKKQPPPFIAGSSVT